MTLCLREMKSEVEGRTQGNECTAEEDTGSVEYRANILLIALDSLHLWGLRY